jgi:hypothetical protein
MKNIKTTIAIFIVSFFAISCSKDDSAPTPTPAPVYQEENFLTSFLSQANFPAPFASSNELFATENGLSFKPTVKGKITSFLIKSPQSQDIEVTLWDASTKTKITSLTIETIPNTFIKGTLSTPINLEKGKEYTISFFSDDRYNYEKATAISYPVVCGNITITNNLVTISGSGYPTINADDKFYSGDCTFTFIRTE